MRKLIFIGIATLLASCSKESNHRELEPYPSPNTPKFDRLANEFRDSGFREEVEQYVRQGAFFQSIVFTGSSTFTNWQDLEIRYAKYRVIKRAIGGSDIRQIIAHSESLVYMHHPRAVVLYIGDNDAYMFSPATFKEYLECWIDNLFWRFHQTKLVLVSVKPSPARAEKHPLYQQINALYAAAADRLPNVYFADIWQPLAADPWRYFLPDGIHINAESYNLLFKQLTPILDSITSAAGPS